MNTPEFSNDFIILIISFMSSFEINKVNPFCAPTAPFLLIFLSNLFIGFEVKLLTNPGKLSFAKGIAIFAFLNYLTKNRKIYLVGLFYQVYFTYFTLQSSISVDILLAKAFLILVVSLIVRNN